MGDNGGEEVMSLDLMGLDARDWGVTGDSHSRLGPQLPFLSSFLLPDMTFLAISPCWDRVSSPSQHM